MPHHPWRGVVALTLAAGLLAGCAGGDDEPEETDAAAGPPDCSAEQCEEQVAALVTEIESLDTVSTVEQARYVPDSNTDTALVSGVLRVSDSGAEACAGLEDELGRLAWLSAIAPLGAVRFQCAPDGVDLSLGEYLNVSFDGDPEAAEEKWGPRPTGG